MLTNILCHFAYWNMLASVVVCFPPPPFFSCYLSTCFDNYIYVLERYASLGKDVWDGDPCKCDVYLYVSPLLN